MRSDTKIILNAWVEIVLGIFSIGTAILTLIVKAVPYIWIGGFIFGAICFVRASQRFDTLNDRENQKRVDNDNEISITCGKCGYINRIRKGAGVVELPCVKCGRVAKVFG